MNNHDEKVIITRHRLDIMVKALMAANAKDDKEFNSKMNELLHLKCHITPTF